MSNAQLEARLRRLAAAYLIGLAIAAGGTFYWGVVRADELGARPDNPRAAMADRRIERGSILDRGGNALAYTSFDAAGRPSRVYPVPAAAPVVGYQTWRYGAGAIPGATYGAGGAEAAYDAALRGDVGRPVREIIAGRILGRAGIGRDVVLTVDAGLQTAAYTALGSREGAVVVLDVDDGAVLALVSRPTFDPASLDADPSDVLDDAARPLLNRATQGLYPPGSTWKAVTLSAALTEGIADPREVRDDGRAVEYFDGYAVSCDNNPPEAVRFDLVRAFAYSCNVTFARLGAALGADRMRAHAAAFGIVDEPPFPLPTVAGNIGLEDDGDLPALASTAFGQGELLVTPMHMALVAAAIARGGRMPKPYLLADVPGARWRGIADERGTWRRPMAGRVARGVSEAMAVSALEGWARSAYQGRTPGFTLGGKTGTAEAPGGEPHAWFIGFAPADEPTVAIAVLVARGGDGATAAGPIAGMLLEMAVEVAR